MSEILDQILSFWTSLVAIILIIAAFFLNKWIFDSVLRGKEKSTVVRQIITVLIALVGLIFFTLSLPIDPTLKGQILSLLGIVLSAGFALSSTTLIGNALAGVMNNSVKNFKLGDFVRVENNFGRVTKKGLFRTEIQTEDRNLSSLPNLYIASHPLKIIRESGTIVSTNISLGYDINRTTIEKILLQAAEEMELKEPFVYINNLGDFSVDYRINGLLTDTNKYFTAHSLLNAKVLDHLHQNGVEIVSPTFMNQRQVDDQKYIPPIIKTIDKGDAERIPEDLVFDKGMKADRINEGLKMSPLNMRFTR